MKMMHDPGAGGPTVLQWHDIDDRRALSPRSLRNEPDLMYLSMYVSCDCGRCLLVLEMCARDARRGGRCGRPARPGASSGPARGRAGAGPAVAPPRRSTQRRVAF
jgi:hypothetical protein